MQPKIGKKAAYNVHDSIRYLGSQGMGEIKIRSALSNVIPRRQVPKSNVYYFMTPLKIQLLNIHHNVYISYFLGNFKNNWRKNQKKISKQSYLTNKELHFNKYKTEKWMQLILLKKYKRRLVLK
jgi:hypothetical protein